MQKRALSHVRTAKECLFLNLILPNNKKIKLPGGKTYQERLDIINGILAEYEDVFSEYWESSRTKTSLNIMADYLSRSKEFRENNPNPTLGANRKQRLYKGDKDMIPFSSLHKQTKELLGLEDDTQDSYE